jgi:hypothetical protein
LFETMQRDMARARGGGTKAAIGAAVDQRAEDLLFEAARVSQRPRLTEGEEMAMYAAARDRQAPSRIPRARSLVAPPAAPPPRAPTLAPAPLAARTPSPLSNSSSIEDLSSRLNLLRAQRRVSTGASVLAGRSSMVSDTTSSPPLQSAPAARDNEVSIHRINAQIEQLSRQASDPALSDATRFAVRRQLAIARANRMRLERQQQQQQEQEQEQK